MHAESFSRVQYSTITPFQLSASAGRIVIGIKELSEIIHKSPSTIATWVTTAPQKLPPLFKDGSNSVLWMLEDVWRWQDEVRARSLIQPWNAPINNEAQENNTKGRRGAPSAIEKTAAKNAGLSIKEYRKSKGHE